MSVKKVLTIFVAVATVFATLPTIGWASSTNSMEKTITVMPDSCFSNTFQMKLNGPVSDLGTEKFSISLNNGSFAKFTKHGNRENNNMVTAFLILSIEKSSFFPSRFVINVSICSCIMIVYAKSALLCIFFHPRTYKFLFRVSRQVF